MSNTSQKTADLTAKPLATLSGHKASIHGIAYLPGGKRVVTCSFDKTVRIWDVEMGEQEGTSMVHEGRVYGLAVTRDGKRILSGGDDKKIRIWDAETHQLIEEWPDQTRGIFCIALSPDDQLVASGHSSGKIEIRKVKESGEITHSLDAGSWFTGVFSLCFSPSGEKLACAVNSWTGGVHDIKVYDVQSGELVLGPISGHEGNVCCVLWSLNGSQIFSASRDRTIRCWNSKTAEPIGEPWTGHRHPVMSLSLSPDGAELASVSLDKTLCLWNVHSGGLRIEPPSQHQHGIRAVAFSPSGEFVASGGNDHKVSIWSVPWWDETKKQAHGSLLDLPAVPVPMDRHQGEFDFLDLPLSRRSTTLSSRLPNCPTDSATAPIATRIHRFWRGLIVRSSSSPPWKTSELQHTHDRRFWKPAVRIPVTQVAAGQLTARLQGGRSISRKKKKAVKSKAKDEESHKPHKHQMYAGSSAAEPGPSSSHAVAFTPNAGLSGPSTSSNAIPTAGRASSFAQSKTGSDDSWDDMDGRGECADYFCFGPRKNCEKFRPWKKKSRAVMEAEEQEKKAKKRENARSHRTTKAADPPNAVHPPHHPEPKRDSIKTVSPASSGADETGLRRAVLQLQEQVEQLRLRLDDPKRKKEKEKEGLEENEPSPAAEGGPSSRSSAGSSTPKGVHSTSSNAPLVGHRG